MELHVKVLAVLYIAYGAFGLVLSLLMLFVFGDVTGLVDLAAVEESEALLTVPIIGVIGTFIIGFMLALSVLGLVNFPFGTALGAYGLWVLLSKATGPVFSLAPTATGGPLMSPTGAAAFVELVRFRAAGRTTPATPRHVAQCAARATILQLGPRRDRLQGSQAPRSAQTVGAHPSRAGVAQLVEQLIRNQQVSSSSLLAGSNLALIKRAASDAVLMGALSDPTICANYVRIFPA